MNENSDQGNGKIPADQPDSATEKPSATFAGRAEELAKKAREKVESGVKQAADAFQKAGGVEGVKKSVADAAQKAKNKFEAAGGVNGIKARISKIIEEVRNGFVPDDGLTSFKGLASRFKNLWKSSIAGKSTVIIVAVVLLSFIFHGGKTNNRPTGGSSSTIDWSEGLQYTSKTAQLDTSLPITSPNTLSVTGVVVGIQGELNNAGEVVVSSVIPDSPAAQKGILKDDIITMINSQGVRRPEQLISILMFHNPSDSLSVNYKRGDKSDAVWMFGETNLATIYYNPSIAKTQAGDAGGDRRLSLGKYDGVDDASMTYAYLFTTNITPDENAANVLHAIYQYWDSTFGIFDRNSNDPESTKTYSVFNANLLGMIFHAATKAKSEAISPLAVGAYEAMYIVLRDYYIPNYGNMPGVKEAAEILRPVYKDIVTKREAKFQEDIANINKKYRHSGGWKFLKWGMSEEDVLLACKCVAPTNMPTQELLFNQSRNAGLYCDMGGRKQYEIPPSDMTSWYFSNPYGINIFFYKNKLIAVVVDAHKQLDEQTQETHPLIDALKNDYPNGKIIGETVESMPSSEAPMFDRRLLLSAEVVQFIADDGDTLVHTVQYGLARLNEAEGIYFYDSQAIKAFTCSEF